MITFFLTRRERRKEARRRARPGRPVPRRREWIGNLRLSDVDVDYSRHGAPRAFTTWRCCRCTGALRNPTLADVAQHERCPIASVERVRVGADGPVGLF